MDEWRASSAQQQQQQPQPPLNAVQREAERQREVAVLMAQGVPHGAALARAAAAMAARRGGAPQVNEAARRAREWVEATLAWASSELRAEAAEVRRAEAAAAAPGAPLTAATAAAERRAALDGFVEQLMAALATWRGPELLVPLAALLQADEVAAGLGAGLGASLGAAAPAPLRPPPAAVAAALPRALLPLAGRRGAVERLEAWKDGRYAAALRSLLTDARLTEALPSDVLRRAAVTYWVRVSVCMYRGDVSE